MTEGLPLQSYQVRGGSRRAREGVSQRLRVILLGDMKVGKTSILRRFVEGTFDEEVDRTNATEEREKEVVVDDCRYVLRLVDTCGAERFRSLTGNFYRGSHICLLTFALSDFSSFCNISMWREEFLYYTGVSSLSQFPFVVVGNKADIEQRAVADVNVRAWCQANHEMPYVETSAKTALNVDEVFNAAVRRFHELKSDNRLTSSFASGHSDSGDVITDLGASKLRTRGKGKCCS